MNQGFSFGCGPSLAYLPVLLSPPYNRGLERELRVPWRGSWGYNMTLWWGPPPQRGYSQVISKGPNCCPTLCPQS